MPPSTAETTEQPHTTAAQAESVRTLIETAVSPAEAQTPSPGDSDTSLRYELKFVIGRNQLHRVRVWLGLHAAGFRNHHPARQVNSLYFDTFDMSCLGANLAGLAERSKLRLRWYGRDLTRPRGILELKSKQAAVGRKHQHHLAGTLRLDQGTWWDVVGRLRRVLPMSWRTRLDLVCRPVVIVSYRREYLISADRLIRATLDLAPAAYDQWRSQRPNLCWKTPVADTVIVELKCGIEHRERLTEVAGAFPIRRRRSSKYVSAFQATTL